MKKPSLTLVSILFILFVFISIALTGCSDNNPVDNKPIVEPVGELTKKNLIVSSGSEKFGIKLFKQITSLQPDSNVIISPLSISTALGMALNGADGNTYHEMKGVLELNELSQYEINEAYKSLVSILENADPKVKFNIANAIWHRNDRTFVEKFIEDNKSYYDALVKPSDFSDPNLVNEINGWIENKTNGKIKNMLDRVPASTIMYLVNALYFNGTWKSAFNANETQDRSFMLSNGDYIDCPTMSQRAEFEYFSNGDFKAVNLPYGDGNFCMTLLVPEGNKSVSSLYESLDFYNWQSYAKLFEKRELSIFFPKFKAEYKLLLNESLIGLGMKDAFTPAADFTNLYAPGGIFISRVLHNTFIEVDEKGTEAAAATIIEFKETSVQDDQIHFNKPFIFIIREQQSGSILFIGQIVNPIQ